MKSFVSVIVPTYHDWKRLRLCLKALKDQSYPQSEFEVIAVNNDPSDLPPKDFKIENNVKIISESKSGSYAARNAALKITKGDIIGFTDSDCIPDENWILNAVNTFKETKDFQRIGGKIEVFLTASPSLAEYYDKVFAFPQKLYVSKDSTAVTANMFALSNIFKKTGGFDEQLKSGGDFEWGIRAQRNGFAIKYESKVVIHHPARPSLEELVKKEKRVGKGQRDFLEKSRLSKSDLFYLLGLLRPQKREMKIIRQKLKEDKLSDITIFRIAMLRRYLILIRNLCRMNILR